MNTAKKLHPADEIRSYAIFKDSTDIDELQQAVDAVKAIAAQATVENATAIYSAKVEVLGPLMLQFNRLSVAAKNAPPVLGDVFPPEIEDAVHPVITDIAAEIQHQRISRQTRDALDLHRAWCVGCIARAPAVECADTRAMVHGVVQTLTDEIAVIDEILAAAN